MGVTLAISTCGPQLEVALRPAPGAVPSVVRLAGLSPRSTLLLAAIDLLAEDAGCAPGAIERVVVSRGPGSFTGIRAGLATAALLWVLVTRTRVGMLVRAGASNPRMVAALGVDIRRLFMIVFGFGAALAGLAGLMAGPIYAVQPGMGELILIQVFVVIVIGGIGSIRGAFAGAIIVGMVDTMGRAFLKPALGALISPTAAEAAGPALASMLIYLLMAVVLALRPEGLFPARGH